MSRLSGQQTDLFFEHLTTDQGLSQNDVNCITQDSTGFMWFGTNDGLNRYDGYHFTVYKPSESDSFSITSNLINCLEIDQQGKIWVGTTGFGISCFDPLTERFTNYRHDPNDFSSLPNDHILDIHADRNQHLWVATSGGLSLFELTEARDFNGKLLRDITKLMLPREVQQSVVNAIWEDDLGRIWLGAEDGVRLLSLKKRGRIQYVSDLLDAYIQAQCIVGFEDQGVVLGGNNGLYWFDPETMKMQVIDQQGNQSVIVRDGEIWTASHMGLARYAAAEIGEIPKLVQRYHADPRLPYSLNRTVLHHIFGDRNGLIWLGTNGGGINRFDPEKKVFASYLRKPDLRINEKIRSIYEDSQENLWVGTEGSGVHFLPKPNGEPAAQEAFQILNTPSYCFAIEEYEQNGQRFLAMGGQTVPSLYRIRLNDNIRQVASRQIQAFPEIIGSVFSILNQDNRYLWVGTYRMGLYRIPLNNPEDSVVQFLHHENKPGSISSNLIRSIMQDKEGNIWVGSGNGLNLISRAESIRPNPVFTHFFFEEGDSTSLSHNYILDIFQSKNRQIWIGTFGGGLNQYIAGSEQTKSHFIRYSESDGLPNNVVKGLQEDLAGYLWVSTNKGLSRFDTQTRIFRNFDTNDGLQSDEFSELARYRLQNGKLLFGGVNGFNVFQPDNLYMNPFPPEIAFTSFQILNRPINAGDQFNGRVILEKSISQTEQIHLNYDENSFSVEFAALHFSAPTKNQYAFRLEGFQEEWAYVDAGKRFATFTNLGPGEYTLQVKASNNDGLWNNQIKNLVIRISPPFWQTWWAFLIYFFTFVGLLWAFRRYTVIGIREKHDLVLERLDKEKTEEIQQLKLQFFTNISHEIRTPLTLITGPLEYLLTSGRGLAYEDREKQYLLIRKNADFLLRLVNQLLDFRKIDQKQFSLKVFESDIVSYVKEITEPFQFIANKKNLTYTFHADVPHLTAWFDPDIIDKTLNNLLSNAFKFTPEGGKVEVHISALTPAETKGTSISGLHGLELRILDSGPGIPEEDREHVFDRFFKSKQDSGENSLGAGIGLSYTRDLIHLHQGIIKVEPATLGGACFVVQIPVEGAAYNQENIGAPSELRTREQIPIWDQYKDETEAEKTQEESTNNEETAPQVSILVVDDNKDIRSFVRNALQQSYQIYEAEDGIEGLEMAKEHSPDLIISDIMMPRMNGIELCQELKSNPLTSHIAVIMLTARASDESEKESLEFGADAYIRKPFKLDLLQLKVKNLLRLRNQIHQQFRKEVILQPEAVSATSTDEIFLKKAMDLIEEHMTDPDFNVENMAVEIGMSRSKLYLKLKALTGQSSSEFIRRVRLKRAVQLLESSDLTVKEIMYMTGFNTASYFSKCFKKVYGIVPSEYVSKRKQNHPTHTASE